MKTYKIVAICSIALTLLACKPNVKNAPSVKTSEPTVSPLNSGKAAEPKFPSPPRIVYEPPQEYPEEAFRQGHQGKVILAFAIRENGDVSQPAIERTSRSRVLDAAAFRYVQKFKFEPARDKNGKAFTQKALMPVEYWKDTLANVNSKKCSDLTVDVHFFKDAYPDKKLTEMRIYRMVLGYFVISAKDIHQQLEYGKRFPSVFDRVVEACAKYPDETFGEVLAGAMR